MRAASTKPSGAVGCGCSLCNGASGLGTPLCAGERGVEGAGISRGARFVIGASARPECGRPLQNLLVRLVAGFVEAVSSRAFRDETGRFLSVVNVNRNAQHSIYIWFI